MSTSPSVAWSRSPQGVGESVQGAVWTNPPRLLADLVYGVFRQTVKFFFILVTLILFPLTACSADSSGYLEKAQQALEKGSAPQADFWMARYLANGQLDPVLIKSFLKKRRLEPGSFLSSEYDPEFVGWFTQSTYAQWAVPEDKIKTMVRSFEIVSNHQNDYFVTLTATPALQTWFQGGPPVRTLFLAMGDHKPKPVIYAGKLVSGRPAVVFPIVTVEMGRHFLHHVWLPEFHDADGDSIPEVWIRYNLTVAEGFSQVLEVYKIQENRGLVLLTRFKGEFDGTARRLSDGKVEVLTGCGSRPSLPRSQFDQHRVTLYEFRQGEFQKVSETMVEHILRSNAWKKYYL